MRIFQEEIFGPVLSVTTFKVLKKHLKLPMTLYMDLVQVYGHVI